MFEFIKYFLWFMIIAAVFKACSGGENNKDADYNAAEHNAVSTNETFKTRDNFIVAIKDANSTQDAVKAQFQNASDQFMQLINFHGGALEDKYVELQKEYLKSKELLNDFQNKINKIKKSASNLFKEWDKEIEQYSDGKIQAKSKELKDESVKQYEMIIVLMERNEQNLEDYLKILGDNVLFLKHNLNSKAVFSLREVSAELQGNINDIILDIDNSITKTNEFIQHMKN